MNKQKIDNLLVTIFFLFFLFAPPRGVVQIAPVATTVETASIVSTEEVAEEEVTPKKKKKAKKVSKKLDSKALDYIGRFSEVAMAEHKKYGVLASITLAQGLLESQKGQSKLARENNNHFGVKCHSKTCKKGHCSNFSDDSHKDFFRIYTSAWRSYRAHSLLLINSRYKHLLDYKKDYKKWAHGLKEAGYATDPKYAKKLIKLIEDYDLTQYDKSY